jgi:1,5-anhydro-D-fructose reductase (1,5-anhydro-D-mannitol-forming)
MSRVGYALIGFGGIAENRISREGFCVDRRRFRPHPNAALLGVHDANPARKAAAQALGLRWYDSLDEVLSDPKVHAVFITTDNLSHGPIAEKALQAGRHCMVEKPIATTLEQARLLQGLARQNKLSLAVDHMMQENAYNVRAAEIVRDGSIGVVNDITLHMEFLYGGTEEEAKTWRCADPSQLGGPLGDVGSHCLYMAEFLIRSPITGIACSYFPKRLKINVEDGALVQFSFANGCHGTARVAFNCARGGLSGTLTNLGYEIYGAQATLRGFATLFQLSGHPGEPVKLRLELDRAGRTSRIKAGPIVNIYMQSIRRHAESILNKEPMDGTEAIHNLALILACHESARSSGRAVTL